MSSQLDKCLASYPPMIIRHVPQCFKELTDRNCSDSLNLMNQVICSLCLWTVVVYPHYSHSFLFFFFFPLCICKQCLLHMVVYACGHMYICRCIHMCRCIQMPGVNISLFPSNCFSILSSETGFLTDPGSHCLGVDCLAHKSFRIYTSSPQLWDCGHYVHHAQTAMGYSLSRLSPLCLYSTHFIQ